MKKSFPLKECAEYVAKWDTGDTVHSVRMDGNNDLMTEMCIQSLVVEMLRDLLFKKKLPPELLQGTAEFNNWWAEAFIVANRGMDFGLDIFQEDAVKNLAYNYWIDGINKILRDTRQKEPHRVIPIRRDLMRKVN